MTGPKEQQLRVLRDASGRFLKGGGVSEPQPASTAHPASNGGVSASTAAHEAWALAQIEKQRAYNRTYMRAYRARKKGTPSP